MLVRWTGKLAPLGGKYLLSVQSSFINRGLTQTECEVETLFMFVAGSDTTASVMRITLFNIISSPPVYARLKAEIASAIRDGRASSPITNAEARELPYLQVGICAAPMGSEAC